MIFTVEGQPQGKARPRFSRRSRSVYTPRKTVAYEDLVAKCYHDAGGKLYPDDCYIRISVNAFFGIPKSYSKKKRMQCINDEIRPTKKPDIDNILKVILDALNGVAYEDDRQVVYVRCHKYYADSEMGHVDIEIAEVKE